MHGYFDIYESEDEPFSIVFGLHEEHAKETIPRDQEELYLQIAKANRVIKSLHKAKEEDKSIYFKKLLSLAEAGLTEETAQPDLASKALVELKSEMILLEGQRIKNEYMIDLGRDALILSVFALIFIFWSYRILPPYVVMYFFVFIGALVGTWISFGARRFAITFEQLGLLEEDMMRPWIRLLYIGTCSVVLILFLNTMLISIEIGGISTTTIKDSYELQIAFGVLCGLIESKIGANVYKRAVSALSKSNV